MNFFKDIKENSSINNLGSKIKNISQTNWLPETKEILASAASTIATNLSESNQSTGPTQLPKQTPVSRQKSDSSRPTSTSPSKLYPQKSLSNQYHSRDQSEQRHRYEEDEPVYETSKKLPQIPNQKSHQPRNPEQIRAGLSRNASFRSRSPDSPTEDPNKIDPLQYNALVETNQALKTELQRLSIYETKCKQLEKEASNSKVLRETNENLQQQIQNLLEYREKCEKLEIDMKAIKTRGDKLSKNFEILTDENINLTNKIKDLDRLLEENELLIGELKQKELLMKQELESMRDSKRLIEENEQLIRDLRHRESQMKREIEDLKDSKRLIEEKENIIRDLKLEMQDVKNSESSNVMLNQQKVSSLEQANKILEQELDSLKEQQKSEREKVKEKMTLLNSKQNEKIKKLEEEKRLVEVELTKLRKELHSSKESDREIVTLKDLNQKYEDEIEVLRIQLKEKKSELEEIVRQREIENANYLEKMKLLNDENVNLCNQFSSNSLSKDDELNKLSKKLLEMEKENNSLRQKCTKLLNMEKELNETNRKNEDLRLECQKLRHELDDCRAHGQQLKHDLTNETLKNENLAADFSLLRLELNKLESFKGKCEQLERELDDLKRIKTSRIIDFESTNRKFTESSDKYEYEIKILNTQINSLQNDMKLKDQEYKQLEKVLDNERNKTNSLLRQIDELKTLNTDLTIQVSDSKRRLVSLDLLTEECNQLRKNLTMMTIESESKKAEVTTLNSQINILENTLKQLRENSEKHNSLENNYESTVYELKKKQEDYKKLQQIHDSVKKEHLETIEILEEKLKDVEKKTELQALKHEEILLELESIRARRERLLPLCPNCSSQTYPMYQPMSQTSTQTPQSQSQSQSQSPRHQYVPYVHPNGQLLSISIPQQSVISPLISPLQFSQGHLQVITLPGKQSVTVDCQTSPLYEKKIEFNNKDLIENQAIERYKRLNDRPKISRASQTFEIETVKNFRENKSVNTDVIEMNTKSNQTIQIYETKQNKPVMKNEGIYVNIFDEIKRNSTTQTIPVMPKLYDDKLIQCDDKDLGLIVKEKEKYFLYTCKYNYDPIKSSPNQNPALELPLRNGDYLYILNEKDEDGFLNGELLNGKRGITPSNFVERVKIDSNSFNKIIETLPKDVLNSAKFGEMLNSYDINLGQIFTQLFDQIQKLQTSQSKSNDLLMTAPQSVIAPKQTVLSKNEKQFINEQKVDEQIKIGLPYPNNLRVEKRSEKSLLIYWDPPTAPLPIDQSIDSDNINTNDFNKQIVEVNSYNLFLNDELHSVINGNEDRIAIIEDIDLSVPNRISIQAVASKDRMSKPQECTLSIGSNRSFAPSNLAVHNLSQTSAIVSWWPSSSQFSHIISIDSIEHRTLKPGVYRFKLSGLLPDTSHLITIRAQIHNHTNELNSNYAASIEFRTLPSRILANPTDLNIDKDPSEVDTFILSWNPVVTLPNQLSNGIPVGGYSIYLDGARVHQILNPIASSVSLSSKILNGAKSVSVRTLSLDGNSESKDSEIIKLSKILLDDLRKKSIHKIEPAQSQPLPRPKPVQVEPPPQTNQVKRATAQPSIIAQMPKVSDANRKKSKIDTKTSIDNEADLYENNRANPLPVNNNVQNAKKKTSRQGSPNSSVGTANNPNKPKSKSSGSKSSKNYRLFIALFDYDPFKMSPNTDSCQEELPFKEGQLIKIFGDQDSDGFYYGESNGRTGYIPCNMVSEVQADDQEIGSKLLDSDSKQKRKESLPQKNNVQNKTSSKTGSTKPINSKSTSKDQQFVPINKYSKCMTMIALYDYDPQSLSPNVDAESELAFKTGQIITVYDEMDDDGFYMGELNGKRGFVPSNFLQPLDQNSQYVSGDTKK